MERTYEVLLGMVHKFDPDDPGDNALIDRMTRLDRAAARDGTADRLFANIVARPRANPRLQSLCCCPPQ